MYLQPKKTTSTGAIPVFQKVLETLQGGVALDLTGLTAGVIIPAGSAVSVDEATRTAKIIKTATLQANAANNATTYRVMKGHIIATGNYLAATVGGASYAVSAIDTSNADYDELIIGTTLGVALTAGIALFVSTATGASNAAHPAFSGLLYEDEEAQASNPVSVVIRGTAYERRIPGVIASMKTTMMTLLYSKSY